MDLSQSTSPSEVVQAVPPLWGLCEGDCSCSTGSLRRQAVRQDAMHKLHVVLSITPDPQGPALCAWSCLSVPEPGPREPGRSISGT